MTDLDKHAKVHVPSVERVKEAHSWMSREGWEEPGGIGHTVYSQEADTQCYLCAILVLLEKAETETKSLQSKVNDYGNTIDYLNAVILRLRQEAQNKDSQIQGLLMRTHVI